MNIENLTDDEIIKKLDTQFGKVLTYISPAPHLPNRNGGRTFRCRDLDAEAVLTVDNDGYITSRILNSTYADVVGQLLK